MQKTMQTCVDRKSGSECSSNSSNINFITTTNATSTTTSTTTSTPPIVAEASHIRHVPSGSYDTAATISSNDLQPTHVLRQRLQVAYTRATTVGHQQATITTCQSSNVLLTDAATHLGSNVEQMSATPTHSPQASPSKARFTMSPTSKLYIASRATTTTVIDACSDAGCSAASSDSNSSLDSNSQSAVIPAVLGAPNTPTKQARNGNVTHVQDIVHNISYDSLAEVSGTPRTSERKEVHATKVFAVPPPTQLLSALGSLDEQYVITALSAPLTPSWPTASAPKAVSASSTSSSSTTSSLATPLCTTPPATSPTSNKSVTMEAQLLHWNDMPRHLQFNPYVLKGYRPLQTFQGCLLSLFYWHNETINILTHAIPIFYILATVPGLMPWEQEYRFLSFCHVFGSVAPWCGSFVYHLFMNLETGECVYYRLLKLDMIGIWVSQSFGALPLVTATAFCFSYKWKWFIIISYCLLSLWGLYKALTASSPWQRRLCFALPFTMRSILTFLRTLGWVGGNRVALSHVYLQDVVSVLGGAIGAMRIPEKWFPGLVDFYLNSHNIMHVLVVVAVYSMHKATVKDFEWMSATNCDVTLTNATGEAIETNLGSNIEL